MRPRGIVKAIHIVDKKVCNFVDKKLSGMKCVYFDNLSTTTMINYTYLVRTLTCVWYGSVFEPCKPIHTINLYTMTNIYTAEG
jgi:hypothetical protein